MAQFNLTYDLNVTLEQRLGFEMAAQIWSQFLTDDTTINLHISAVDDLDNGQAVGGAVPIFHEVHYGVYQEYLALDATSGEDASVLGALQDGNTVDFLLDGELVDGNTTLMLTRAQAKALGMDEALTLADGSTWTHDMVQDPNALDGYVVINNSYDWNYDFTREGATPEGELDFLTMALHELGHSLGFVSGLDGLIETFELHSGETRTEGMTALDLFRYSDTSVTIDNPDGAVSDLSFGGAAYFSLDGGSTALAEFEEGNEYQASHWQRFQAALGIMDPTLGYQERTNISQLDLQAFDVLGWDVDYGVLQEGLNLNALYEDALQAISQDFGVGVAAVETAVESGQDWYTMGYGSWWQAFKDQMIEMGYGQWWQEFETEMLGMGYGQWWQAFDQQMSEMGYGQWWQAFQDQVLEMGYGQWWQAFESDMLAMGYGQWWQQFEPQMLEMGYGGWWHVFEQQMLAMGYGQWWQEFEANLLDMGYGSWWQAFEDQVLEMGYGSWWQIFEEQVLDMGYGQWWQQFEGVLLEMGYGQWWQAFEMGYGSWWQEIEEQLSKLADIATATVTTTETAADGTVTETTTVTGSIGDDILAGGETTRDLISGDAGYDLIDGKGGDDVLLGGAGDDLVYGWTGNDVLHGGIGDDFLAGEDGDDRIYGEDGHDILSGGRGHDILEGGAGRDVLKGDTDNDVLDGGAGVDDLAGGSGNDIVIGGDGADVLSGGTGDDQLYGDAHNPNLSSSAENSPDPANDSATDSTTTSEELLSSLGVSTVSNLLDFWVRLEAEDMTLTSYNSDIQGDASNGEVIATSSGFLSSIFQSKARTDFSGPTGVYQLVVGYYDDNANTSDVTLKIGREGDQQNQEGQQDQQGQQGWQSWLTGLLENWLGSEDGTVAEYSWSLDQGVGSESTSDNFFTYVIDDVSLESGDRIELIANAVGNEQVRIDYIDVIAVNPENQLASDDSDRLLGTEFYNGNFYAVASSTATAAAEATSRGGSLISPQAGSQLAIWLQNALGSTANIIEIQGEGDELNLVASTKSDQNDVQRLEAESGTFTDGYSAVDETDYDIVASGDSLLTTTNTVTPSSTQLTVETAGVYNIYANYFDSDAGVAEATVLLNGAALHSWQFNQDDNQMHSRVLGLDVILEQGDVLEIQALANGGDQAAIDYLTLEKATTQDSALAINNGSLSTLRYEAESMDLSSSAHSEQISGADASGGYGVRTADGVEGLTATTEFTGATGFYDIVVGYFDGLDGVASYSATLAGSLLETWQADLSLNNSGIGADNLVTRTVARGQLVQTGDSITLQSIRGLDDYAAVDYVEFIAHDPTAAMRVEAEYMTLSGEYQLNQFNFASAGRTIESKDESIDKTVNLSTTFDGRAGAYDIVVGYYDQNDGAAQFTASVGGVQQASWVADQNLGSTEVSAQTFTTYTLSDVDLTPGDTVLLTSQRHLSDHGQVDYIEFVPVVPDAQTNTPQTVVQLEAESMDLSGVVDIDSGAFASGGQFVNVGMYYGDDDDDGGGADQQFRATDLFTGETGYYDVVVGYYDENDGAAEIIVNISNQEADRWFADQNLGTSLISADSFTTHTVASGLYIEQTDLIELTSIENGGDRGTIDYIQFIEVEEPTPPTPVTTEPLEGNADILRGGLGDDILDGGLGDDILYGEDELDTGGGGNDILYGGEGNDSLFGNSGDDTLYGDFFETDTTSADSPTPSGQTYNDSLYLLTDSTMSWEAAQSHAESLGGNLVTINDAAEEQWLKDTFSSTTNYWIGLNDKVVEGQFEWISGEAVTYTNWDGDNPNNSGGNQDYVEMNYNSGWNDAYTSSTRQGVIEIKLEPEVSLTSGDDTLNGGQGNDILYGGEGNDILYGEDEFDTDQAAGNDTLYGGQGDDSLFGNSGNDTIYGDSYIDPAASTPTSLPNGETYNDSLYLLTDSTMSWEAAQAHAESLGGNLVTINDAAEEQWLKATFSSTTNYWIGLTDKVVEGQFEWISGEAATYTNWDGNNPNNSGGNQDYVEMNYNSGWNDTYTSSTRRGIIEIKLEPEGGLDTLVGGGGDDTLYGGGGDDILNGTDGVAVGLNELDSLIGGGGADQFILGDAGSAYYHQGGVADFVTIQDFDLGVDTVQLYGSLTDYSQTSQGADTLLYWQGQDLVAQFNGMTSLDLNNASFQFVS